jgi:hypothetical protein
MTNAFSSMGYPHWLIAAGAILLMLGLVGLALRQRSLETHPKDMTNDQEPSEQEAELTPIEVYERDAREKRKVRWAERERELQEPANDKPSIMGEESK